MIKNAQNRKDETWDYALLYLALLKRGEIVPIYDEARKRACRDAQAHHSQEGTR